MGPVLATLSFLLSAGLTRHFCRPDSRLRILDYPNERSLHTRPVPRTGGLAILAAVSVCAIPAALLAQQSQALAWLGGGGLLLSLVSFYDDRSSLHPGYRLPAHIAVAALLLFGGFTLPGLDLPGLSWDWSAGVGAVLSLLFVVWMVNLYNFMDGMDGFAAGMAVSGFSGLAALGWLSGNMAFATAGLIVAAAAAGFLVFNFPPARIFLGDVGSSLLGFLAAGFSLWGVRDGVFPLWAALVIFSPFIVDATVTLARRAARGERLWRAHKTHYYQRLVQLGWGHKKTVAWEYLLFFACMLSAVWGVQQAPATQWLVLLFWGLCYPALMWLVARLERRQTAPA